MNESIFERLNTDYPKLEENINCDILIVGGGLTGISLAYYLKNSNKKIILIDKGKFMNSTSRFSTAKITSIQQDVLTKIKNTCGKSTAYLYYKAQNQAKERIINIIKDLNISCHLEKSPSYLFVTEEKNRKKLKDEVELYKEFGEKITYCNKLPLNFNEKLCAKSNDNYVFNPVLYAKGLLGEIEKNKNITLYENTSLVSLSKENNKYIANIDNNRQIFASKIVFAGHYPPFIIPYLFPIKVYIEKDFVVSKKSKNMKFNAINLDKDILSVRFYKNYMIKVIKSKRLNNNSIEENPYDEQHEYRWINYDLITKDYLPLIGKIKNNLYIATGYNTWGMTNSNFAAYLLADIINNKENEYEKIVNPRRGLTIKTLPKYLFDNTLMSINYITSFFSLTSKPKIIMENGNRIGIVKDNNGVIHKVLITCPHMKCGLKYNKLTNTWDCPCHGSRFDIDGNIIRGPAVKCLKKYDS